MTQPAYVSPVTPNGVILTCELDYILSYLKPCYIKVRFTHKMWEAVNDDVYDYQKTHNAELSYIDRVGYERWYWDSLCKN